MALSRSNSGGARDMGYGPSRNGGNQQAGERKGFQFSGNGKGLLANMNADLSHEQIQRRKQLASILLRAGIAAAGYGYGGIAPVGAAIAGGLLMTGANRAERGMKDENRRKIAEALGRGTYGASRNIPAFGPMPTIDMTRSPEQKIGDDTMLALGKPGAMSVPGYFADLEQQHGLPAGYLARTMQIESNGNPNAQNPNSSAGGAFQFIDSTAKQYGLHGNDRFDMNKSANAAARLAADNAAHLRRVLGRDPTAGELYLAHQQGAGGAASLLSNRNASASSVVGNAATSLNGGRANMTAGEFADLWLGKFGGQLSQPPQRQGNGNNADIYQLLVDPSLTEHQRFVLEQALEDRQRMDQRAYEETRYQRRQQAENDEWTRRQEWELANANTGGTKGVVVQGRVVNPVTGDVIYEPEAAVGPDEYGLNPVFGRDENGNVVVMQLGKDGTAVATDLPDGVTPDLAVKNYEGARGKALGKQEGESTAAASGDRSAAENALRLIEDIRNDPNRARGTGMSSLGNWVPGTGGYDFEKKVEQATSGAFLSAIQQLRGMGALSNTEGKAATAAVTRMTTRLTEKGFLEALDDYERIVRDALKNAQARENQPVPSAQPQQQPLTDEQLIELYGLN
ncbi:MAG: transglycosylase SLT domain-containing protein [Paracoccaceae bacterium]